MYTRYFIIGAIGIIVPAIATITLAQDTINIGSESIEIVDVLNEIAPENEVVTTPSTSPSITPSPKPVQPSKGNTSSNLQIPQATFTPPNTTTETKKDSDQTVLVEFYPTIVSNCMIQDSEIVKCNFGAEYRKNRIDELFAEHIATSQITRKQYETMLKEIYLLSHRLPETNSRQENNSAFMIEYAHYILEKKRNSL